MKDIIFLGGFFPKEIKDEIIKNSKGSVQNAAHALQQSLIRGLFHYFPEMQLINVPFVGSFPFRYKKMYIPSCPVYGISKSLGFCNITYLKQFIIYFSIKKRLNSLLRKNTSNETVVILYSIQVPYLKAVIDTKKHNKRLKVCLIVPDLVEYMGGPSSFIHRTMAKLSTRNLNRLYESVDSYVLLTEYMKNKLPVKNKMYTIVEGIFSQNSSKVRTGNENGDKYLLYTGSLDERFGILNLIEAFTLLDDTSLKLVICGSGNTEIYIRNLSKTNSHIVFKGLLPQEKIPDLQKKAFLLINPRTADNEYTSFSFPSKTMEYFASGTPVLMYKLPGIPAEYFEYCFTLDSDYSSPALAKKIREIYNTDPATLTELGNSARKFILENKNPEKQCAKIKQLIEKL